MHSLDKQTTKGSEMKNITTGQKVKLFNMIGECVGFKSIQKTAKNYYGGGSILLGVVTIPLIKWDGCDFAVTCKDVESLDFI